MTVGDSNKKSTVIVESIEKQGKEVMGDSDDSKKVMTVTLSQNYCHHCHHRHHCHPKKEYEERKGKIKMKFADNEHRRFWNDKYAEMQRLGKTDVYYKSIVYVLGICETTREHFEDIFNLKSGEINIDSLQSAYQTGSSERVTRMAFSLWNRCNYDSEKDIEDGNVSRNYNVSEIFCCSYAPYFYEGIKIRYPEYTKEKNHIRDER